MKVESKVGILFIFTIILITAFFYYLGIINPFSKNNQIHLLYNFAGGIEIGSPVRVMGIKVGKVKKISFMPEMKDIEGNEVKLKITITINEDAWNTVREDSKFYINLAGVIGEKYIEISPGSTGSSKIAAGKIYRGEDPPRIDQLISQSYSLAGKILSLIENNEEDMVHILETVDNLVSNFSKTVVLIDKMSKKGQILSLIKNFEQIAGDVATVSNRLRSKDTAKTIDLIHSLIWRLKDLDEKAIRKFFQEEGVKGRLF